MSYLGKIECMAIWTIGSKIYHWLTCNRDCWSSEIGNFLLIFCDSSSVSGVRLSMLGRLQPSISMPISCHNFAEHADCKCPLSRITIQLNVVIQYTSSAELHMITNHPSLTPAPNGNNLILFISDQLSLYHTSTSINYTQTTPSI